LERFNYTYCADEMFFQSVLLNSHLAGACNNNSLRYMDWRGNGSGPRVLDRVELAHLIAEHRRALFARKFDVTADEWPEIAKALQSSFKGPCNSLA
jgi:hypothetical protein